MNLSKSQYIEQNSTNNCTLYEYIDSLDNNTTKEFAIYNSISDVIGLNATTTIKYQNSSNKYNNQNYILDSSSTYILISAIVLLYTIILTLYRKYNTPLLRSFSYGDRLERIVAMLEANSIKYINLGNILFYIVSSHIICTILKMSGAFDSSANWKIISIIFTLLIAINIYRYIIDRSISYLTNNKMFASSQNLFRKSFNTAIALTLSPLSLIFIYTPELSFDTVSYTLSTLSLVAIITYWRMLYVNLSVQNFSFLEYILYLCSAEIIPTLTIIIVLYRNIA